MSNRWGIPKEVEMFVLQRDLSCVYCGVSFTEINGNRRTRRTWEHIINDIRINGTENIAVCCGSCNASKGNKKLEDWLKSKYCETKKISKESISDVVKKHLAETTTA